MPRPLVLVLGLACAVAALPAAEAGGDKRSPFEMVRYADDRPEVRVRGTWYELVSLDGIPLDRVLAACVALDPDRPKKRFCEDLPEALAGIGHTLGPTVDLVLREPGQAKTKPMKGVPATEANRDRIRRARPYEPPKPIRRVVPVKRVRREHASRPDPAFAFLTVRHHSPNAEPRIPAAQAREDLDQLEWLIENVFSYRDLRSFDRRAAFDTLRLGLDKDIPRADLHIQLRKLVALFGDGHGKLGGVSKVLPPGGLPFALESFGPKVVALDADGLPLDPARPFVSAIDDQPIEAWLDAASRLTPRGSPQFVRFRALFYGGFASFVRRELGLKNANDVRLTLANEKGQRKETKRLTIAARPTLVRRHRSKGREDARPFGYLRIREMVDAPQLVRGVLHMVERQKDAPGLVIDVRANPGGTRDVLRALLPHLMPADATPIVCNMAAYRLPPGEAFDAQNGHLRDRGLFLPDAPELSRAERAAAQRHLGGVTLDWKLTPEVFTPLHVMVVSPARASAWRYTKPIAILIDEACFSATDIFVAALEPLVNVTVIGRATGGGSGRSRGHTLAHSGLKVRLSSMASFRPDGRRYDGVGVAPDIPVARTFAGLAGEEDPILERALTHLREKTKR